MATVGRLVELLRAEVRVADEHGQAAAGERLREMSDDIGEMSPDTQAWIEQANDDELRGFAAAVRLLGS